MWQSESTSFSLPPRASLTDSPQCRCPQAEEEAGRSRSHSFLASVEGGRYDYPAALLAPAALARACARFVLLDVVIGGTQTARGPLVGASFFTLIPEALRIGDDWRFFIYGVIIVIMMIFRPEGIVTRDALERVWRQLFSGKRNV